MTGPGRISINVGNVIPHADKEHTKGIIALWRQLQEQLEDREFQAAVTTKGNDRDIACRVSLDAAEVISLMEAAREKSGSFDAYRREYYKDSSLSVSAVLSITVTSGEDLSSRILSQITTIYIQHLVLVMNIALPGSIQLLNTAYSGDESHYFEAPVFDAIAFYGARNALDSNGWPAMANPSVGDILDWLDRCGTSTMLTAIQGINKVLFTLLKIAEQRQDFSARMVLMVLFQLEVLLDCRNEDSFKLLRNRVSEVLGNIPEQADCIKDLYQVRASLYGGDHPVRRPSLIHHSAGDEVSEQLDQHNNMVELGILLVIALLQDLIVHKSTEYEFGEIMSRKG